MASLHSFARSKINSVMLDRVVDGEDEVGGEIFVSYRERPSLANPPWLVFLEEVEAAQKLGLPVFKVERSRSKKRFVLRCALPKGGGEKVSKEKLDWHVDLCSTRLGSGPVVFREWQESRRFSCDISGRPAYVSVLSGATREEAYGNAVRKIESWGLLPIIYIESEDLVSCSYSCERARAHFEAESEIFERISRIPRPKIPKGVEPLGMSLMALRGAVERLRSAISRGAPGLINEETLYSENRILAYEAASSLKWHEDDFIAKRYVEIGTDTLQDLRALLADLKKPRLVR